MASVVSVFGARSLLHWRSEREARSRERLNRYGFFRYVSSRWVVVSAGAFIAVPKLIPILLPGFRVDPFRRSVSIDPFFCAHRSFPGSELLLDITQMHKRFLVICISPLLYNIGSIIGIHWLVPLGGIRIGIGGGASVHFSHAASHSFISRGCIPRLRFKSTGIVTSVVKLSLPRTLTLSSNSSHILPGRARHSWPVYFGF